MKAMANSHHLGIGKVFHGRSVPKKHQFSMSVYMLWVCLDEAMASEGSLQLGKWVTLSRFVASDYGLKTAHNAQALQTEIIAEWASRGLTTDRVCLLSNPRTLNTSMNPLSVFYCYYKEELVAILAEVTNTPWGERHQYFLTVGDACGVDCTASADWDNGRLVYNFQKNLHVSPFNPIDMGYEMRFVTTDNKLSVVMHLSKGDTRIFNATLHLNMYPLTQDSWRKSFWGKPWLTMQVLLRIYFEALKLIVKGVPFYKHPKKP